LAARIPWTGLAVIAACLLAWEAWALARQDLAEHFPPASRVLLTLVRIVASGELTGHIGATLWRFAQGYAIAAVAAVGAGLCLGLWRPLHNACEPLIELLRPLPSPATIPIAILFLGIGDAMKVAVTVYACAWPILLNTIDGVRAVDRVLAATAATFRLTPWERFWKVLLPAASPQIATGLRVALPIALILVTTAEMVVSNDGLGYYVLESQRTFQMPQMYAAVVMLGIIGYALNRIFLALDARVLDWHKGLTRKEEIL
jgi:NitT/TauT family transport system permease protein/sulfonate transport system permease protein